MQHSADCWKVIDQRQGVRNRTTRVDDDGQIEILRDLQLLFERPALSGALLLLRDIVVIETRLSHGHDPVPGKILPDP